MMASLPIDRSARRALRISWACVLAAAALAAVLLARGRWPDNFPELEECRGWLRGSNAPAIIAIGLGGVACLGAFSVILIKLFLFSGGRPWAFKGEASRSIPLSSLEAEALAERGLARLLEHGFEVDAREPLPPDGWRMQARRRNDLLSQDLRRSAQSLEFRYREGVLVITHRLKKRLFEQGEGDYQDWLVQALSRGAPLDSPPRTLDSISLLMFNVCLLLAVMGWFIHGLPEETWAPAFAIFGIVAAAGAVVTLLGAPLIWFYRSRTTGKALLVPALLLAVSGFFFCASSPDAWQYEPWRTSDDPAVLARAGFSAWRNSDRDRRPERFGPRRVDEAYEARAAIHKRLLAMGGRAAPALAARTDGNDWGSRLLARIGPPAVPALIEALKHHDPDRRWRAIECLDNFQENPGILSAVLDRLKDPDPEVRQFAVEFLINRRNRWSLTPGKRGIETAARALVPLLDDPDPNVRYSAATALGYLKWTDAVPRLLSMLKEERRDYVRAYVIQALIQIGDPRSIPELVDHIGLVGGVRGDSLRPFGVAIIEPLLDLIESGVEWEALAGLRSVTSEDLDLPESVLKRLLDLADDTDRNRRATALHLLARSRHEEATARARRALRSPDVERVLGPLLRRGAAGLDDVVWYLDQDDRHDLAALKDIGDEGRPLAGKLLELAADPALQDNIRTDAIDFLRKHDAATAAALAERLLKDPSEEVRCATIHEGTPAGILLKYIEGPGSAVRVEAIRRLGRRKETAAVATLIRVLKEDTNSWVRSAAADALGDIAAPEAVPALCNAVARGYGGDSRYCGIRAAQALGKIGDAQSRGVLREALRQARKTGRLDAIFAAAAALGMIGDREVIPLLRQAFRVEGDFENQFACDAATALARLGEEGVSQLLEALDGENERGAAAEALGRSGSPRALPRLLEALRDPEFRVRAMAARGLGHLKDGRAVPALVRAVEEEWPSTVLSAAWALERITGEDFAASEEMETPYSYDFVLAAERARSRVREWAARPPK